MPAKEINFLPLLLTLISVYLLIPFIEHIAPGAFYFPESLGERQSLVDHFSLVCFSISTITTLGNHPIVPILPFAQAVVGLEQITGVFYLGVLITRLVAGISLVYEDKLYRK